MSDIVTDTSAAENADARKIGIAWGDDISEERKSELDAILAEWDARAPYSGRKGPFDVTGLLEEMRVRLWLTGADVYYLAARVLIGATPLVENEPIADLAAARAFLKDSRYTWRMFMHRLNLSGANLQNAKLYSAVLAGANLEGAQLQNAVLQSANLHGVRLNRANLTGTSLRNAMLDGARLYGARLAQAELQSARLQGADLQRAVFDADTDLTGIQLGDGRRDSASVADLRWGGANLAVVDWSSLIEPITQLGDERAARKRKPRPYKPSGNDLSREEVARERQIHEEMQERGWLDYYRTAVRANRQLATALRDQGMNEEADAFAYRAQVVQRSVFAQQGKRGRAFLSLFLDLLAGHGYKPARSLYTYLGVLFGFAFLFFLAGNGWLTFGLGTSQYQNLPWYEALILSVSSFHGRGFFQPLQTLGDPVAIIASVRQSSASSSRSPLSLRSRSASSASSVLRFH